MKSVWFGSLLLTTGGCTSLDLWWEDGIPPPENVGIYAVQTPGETPPLDAQSLTQEVVTRLMTEWIARTPPLPRIATSLTRSDSPEITLPRAVLNELASANLVLYTDDDPKAMRLTAECGLEQNAVRPISFELKNAKGESLWKSPVLYLKTPSVQPIRK